MYIEGKKKKGTAALRIAYAAPDAHHTRVPFLHPPITRGDAALHLRQVSWLAAFRAKATFPFPVTQPKLELLHIAVYSDEFAQDLHLLPFSPGSQPQHLRFKKL